MSHFSSSYFVSSLEYLSGFNPTLFSMYFCVTMKTIVKIVPMIIIEYAVVVLSSKNDAISPAITLNTP